MLKKILVLGLGALVACGDSGSSLTTDSAVGPSGGKTQTDGNMGTGGKTGTGGVMGTGGSSTQNSGGVVTTGGMSITGGNQIQGGTTMTGGTTVTGGSSATGGNTTCGAAKPAEAPAGVTPLRAIDGFVTRKDSDLIHCDKPFQVMGTNLYYVQSWSAYGENGLKIVRDAFDDAVRLSLPVVRMWAFYDGHPEDSGSIRKSPEKFEEAGLKALDTAIAEAKKRGIRLILVLTNYWEAYGGLAQYAIWAGAKSKDDFYTNATMQGYFMSYASELSNRTNTVTNIPYKDEPAILAWEIANELRCPKCPIDNIQNTVSKLAGYLKTLFPKHLIADGGEGMDDYPEAYAGISNEYTVRGDEGSSFRSLVTIPELDMVSYHYYPVDWGMTKVETDSAIWINTHQAIAQKAKKVGYWGEFGYKKFASDSERAPIYDRWLTSFFSKTNNGSTSIFWQLVPASRQGVDDGYAVSLAKDTASIAVFNQYAIPRAPR